MGTRIQVKGAGGTDEESKETRRRILVVDDDATIRNILVQVLKLQGYEVQSATNGVEALGVCTNDPRTIDVLITDLMMPLMGGEELIERTMRLRPEMRTICMSAAFTMVSLDLSVLFLPKPFSLRAIVSLVKSALEGTRRRQAESG